MTSPAIRVVDVSKEYILGSKDAEYRTFREAILDTLSAPIRRLRHLGRGEASGAGEQFWALRDVSFDVQPGQLVGIIGRNGAGKSTLLKILSRITEPTNGYIELRGRMASLLEVGTGFHPELSGRENIYLNGSILGMRRAEIERKFDEIVDFSEVERFLDTPVKRYSSGMYVRLAFAVAAHLEPEILVVDEVLAVGDAAFQRKCLGKMQDVGRGGRTVLFVSHNMAAINALCTRGLLLQQGQIVFDGRASEAVSKYLAESVPQAVARWNVEREARRHPDYGQQARLLGFEVLPADGVEFAFGEELRFRLEFSTEMVLTDMGVGIGVEDMFGTRIVTFNSEQAAMRLDVVRGGRYVVELAVPELRLNPGRYALTVGLLSGDRLLDFLLNVGNFGVSHFHGETGEYADVAPGVISASGHWTIVDASVPRPSAVTVLR